MLTTDNFPRGSRHAQLLANKRDGKDALKEAMRLVIRAGNLHRPLIEDRDWQEIMIHLNKVVGKE